jgi:FG-GAP-like repeat/Secretion system C-terminal sorting domain
MEGDMKHLVLILAGFLCSSTLVFAQIEWQEYVLSTNHDGPGDISIADINDDGVPDILATTWDSGDLLYWERDGEEWVERFISSHMSMSGAAVAVDINLDGSTDIAVSDWEGNAIYWFEQTPDSWIQHTINGFAEGAWGLAPADINQDGRIDFFACHYYEDAIVWHEQADEEWVEHVIQTGLGQAPKIRAADFDNDGDIDCVTCAFDDNLLAWYENDNGSFTERVINGNAEEAWTVQAVDFDFDGDVDVLSGSYGGEGLYWYENTDGEWTQHLVASGLQELRDAMAADIDLDGDMDVVAGVAGASAVYWYEQDDNEWIQHTLRTGYDTAWTTYVGDIDNDGDSDILGAALGSDFGGDEFTLWEQLGTPIPDPIDIELHPIVTIVPPGGGTISYGATLYNTTPQPWSLDAWTGVELPNGQVFEPLNRTRGTLPVGTFEIFNLMFNVPSDAPPGTYVFTGYLGRINQGLIAAEDSFTFTKTGAATGTADPTTWFMSPWAITDNSSEDLIADNPSEFRLAPAYPNPFNETTTLSVSLPGTADLSVAVYTTTGRLVTQIADGSHSAGTHSFSIDGSGLASGLYLVKAEVSGELPQVQKLVLVK